MTMRNGVFLLVVSGLIVMIGAWQKILHHPGADTLLAIGLVAELAALAIVIYRLAHRN